MKVCARNWPLPALVVGLLLLSASALRAAPQMLALLETEGTIALSCSGGICSAEFTTYCLQQERDLPHARTPYEWAGQGRLELVLTASNGQVRRLPAAAHVAIETSRAGHSAVTIGLSEQALALLGARSAAIEVGERVALAPVAQAGDPNPLSDQERRLAVGPLRAAGAQIVDRGNGRVGTVRILNRLLNNVPGQIDLAPGAKDRLWRRALGAGFEAAGPGRIARAAGEFDACWRDRIVELGGYSLRECLQGRHDDLMWDEGQRYWQAVGAGS